MIRDKLLGYVYPITDKNVDPSRVIYSQPTTADHVLVSSTGKTGEELLSILKD